MSNVVIYNVYWVPAGDSAPNRDLIDRFTGDLGGPFVNLLSQYGVENKINFGGSWVDSKAVPGGPSLNGRHILQDSDIRGVIADAQNANGAWNPPSLSTLYMVYLPIGTELCQAGNGCTFSPNNSGPRNSAGQTFCAYHGAYIDNSEPQSPIVYGAMPFDGDRMGGCGATNTVTTGDDGSAGPNGDAANDSEISTASHEIFEALTDPEVDTNPAWTNGDNPSDPAFDRSGEIGDLCAYVYHRGSDGGDVTLNGDRYFLQEEWSNATSGCELPGGALTTVTSDASGCTANVFGANDDGSTGPVTLPFSVDYFGTPYTAAWVNNNGNITFDGPLGTYTPFSLLSTHTPIIAPYFSDVDTRGQSPVPSGLVTYGTTTFGGHTAFCVDWRNVGYFGDHTDKRNSFQLLLVQRPDTGPGDFDIVFNYDRVQWETGDASGGRNGFGGGSARAGFSNGTTNSLELVGSGTNGALVDSGGEALSAGSHASTQPGRYIFSVRNGTNAGGATISGRVTDQSSPANPAVGALVQACGGFTTTVVCDLATTNATGNYSITSLPAGLYEVSASPPAGSALVAQSSPAILLPDASLTVDFALAGPAPPPGGTVIGGSTTGPGGIPTLYWQTASPLTTHGCPGGRATFAIVAENSTTGAQQTISGGLTESPAGSGIYSGTIPPLYPLHGAGAVHISTTCPNAGDDADFTFTIYIDPSGLVVDTHGAPVPGATVTLMRSDDPTGPFTVVPNGSAIMSPGNRQNPDQTSATGTFGWDVVAGYYVIRAEKAGCMSPTSSQTYVESDVLTIPPAAAGLELVLSCSAQPPIPTQAFGAATVPLHGSTPLTFTITNPAGNATLTGVALTDHLPGGLVVSTPSGLTGSCGGGTITATAGSATVTLAGASITPGSTCSFAVRVTGTVAGVQTNSVSVNSDNGGDASAPDASVTVVGPPTIAKSFGANSIPFGASTSLTFTLGNPNTATTLDNVRFTDPLPTGLVVSVPSGLTDGCGGGAISASAGATAVGLSGAVLGPGATCTFSVQVTAVAVGVQHNTTSAVASDEGGAGNSAAAALTVVRAPSSVSMAATPASASFGAPVLFTATVAAAQANAGGTSPTGTVSFFLDGQAAPVASLTATGGHASFSTAGLGAGAHKVSAVYGGDANFLGSASNSPAAVAVTCATTVTGSHLGSLTVGPGSTCLAAKTHITGSLIVHPGSAVDVENAAIDGAVLADGSGALRICGSSIAGAVSIRAATGFVLVGDPGDDACQANSIYGSLVMANNTHGLEAIGNHVSGAVAASGNSGPGAFPDDVRPIISGNGQSAPQLAVRSRLGANAFAP